MFYRYTCTEDVKLTYFFTSHNEQIYIDLYGTLPVRRFLTTHFFASVGDLAGWGTGWL